MIHRSSFYSGRRTAFLPGRTIKHFGMPMRFSSGKGRVNALLSLCLTGGMMLGAWLVSAAADGQEDGFISYYASALLRARCTGTFWQVVSSSLFSSFLCLALLLLFAFSCFGAPCVTCLLYTSLSQADTEAAGTGFWHACRAHTSCISRARQAVQGWPAR